jgi:hypothetical protein
MANPPPFASAPNLSAEAEAAYQAALAAYGNGRHAEGLQALGWAAQAGHVQAMALLGGQLLSGRGAPPDPITGARLIMAAAERGSGFACASAAVLVASGVAGEPDWRRALDYLLRSAELGYANAQDQLRTLAGPEVRGNWAALRRAVRLKDWRKPPTARTLHGDPAIQAFDAILTPAVCDWITARGRERLQPAKVYDAVSSGPAAADASRRNSAADFGLADTDLVLLLARERLAAAAGLSVMTMEGPQVLHYAVGERFSQHFDFLDPGFEGHAHDLALRGQRVATVLVYLNDDLEGGETEFRMLDLRYRGGKGDALVFRNVDAKGQPDRRTLHAGLAPTSGEKWLLSQWIRDRAPPGVGDSRFVAALSGR